MPLSEYLQRHYELRLKDLAKEIGDTFNSSEKKGDFNVTRFLEKTEEHLPNKYSFQKTTEIFDRDGNHTQSKDFVIYDRTKNINLITTADKSLILPVDISLAVFEIKTTFTSEELKRSFKQIKEVKSLIYIKKKVKVAEYIADRLNDSTYDTFPPLGIIVAYDYDWSTKTFEESVLKYSKEINENELWDIIYVINKGQLFINYKPKDKPRLLISYVNINLGNSIDLGAAFLNFILILNNKLQGKLKAIPEIDYREEYHLGNWLWKMKAVTYNLS
ncbi:DUF6602 domain-containing protein [Algoriphagus aquimarinus]|uniref:DUF6602 domain-containing protein n=1 Tax=Algoriphagus aquimarinus TaxID=237018 RepID=UPI0030DD722A|tara:strand:- start:7009 stop:7830 length:822 start_codon:yes stop_codon:yes gene_type:complete